MTQKTKKRLPVGIESFEELRRDNFYYVDKTRLIEQLIEKWGKATLFTRPRRFGKSLNMSMIQSFFALGADPKLFDGLYISGNRELCEKYMGHFPVVSISLKGVHAGNFTTARSLLVKVITEEARSVQYLAESPQLTEADRALYRQLLSSDMTDDTLICSLRELTELLERHHKKRVLVLIDEYDVPLAKANEHGYYDDMVLLLRNLFENVLKTNDHLFFAVLTGCLRIARESIFTGLNNFKVYSITTPSFDEYFGFTEREVQEMLQYYNLDAHAPTVKEWYDGYHFGDAEVYCPWDVICYCEDHLDSGRNLPPQNYWLHTSRNEVIEHFIDRMGEQRGITKMELERLVEGESVQKVIYPELTYRDLYASPEHIWSVLFMTGYLTVRGESSDNRYSLAIPNREIRNIVTEHILEQFQRQVADDGTMLKDFCEALANGNPEKVEALFTEYMQKTISVRDTFVRRPTKENFYHGMLLGILAYKAGWTVMSNKEAGDGFSDIMIQTDDSDIGIIIEVKYTNSDEAEEVCRKALAQIQEKNYAEEFRRNDIQRILMYGIACSRKQCRVLLADNAMVCEIE